MSGAMGRLFGGLFGGSAKPKPAEPAPVVQAEPPVVTPAAPAPSPKPSLAQALVNEARQWIGVKEQGSNRGEQVQSFQKTVGSGERNGKGSSEGESWCMSFVQTCVWAVERLNKVKSLLPASEHCLTVWHGSPAAIKSAKPSVGSIVIWQHGSSSNGHTGIVVSVGMDGTLTTVEGNTGTEDHVNGNGDGVYLKHRNPKGSGDMKVVGYLNPFPSA